MWYTFKSSAVQCAIVMVVLKNIPRILSPQLLSVLARMGHGDEIGKIKSWMNPTPLIHSLPFSTAILIYFFSACSAS